MQVPASLLVLLGGQSLFVQGEEFGGGVVGSLSTPSGDVGAVDDLGLLLTVDREAGQELQRELTRRTRAGESDPGKERHRVRRCLTAGALVREMIEQAADGLLSCLLVVQGAQLAGDIGGLPIGVVQVRAVSRAWGSVTVRRP
ncbi:hypothetical protein [Streptomyces coriariae]|uniref:hypothetical protein n=1 Tax=Streptomyces coriariae TaxID=2864460 RepID=UPI001E5631C0|nr:hypothetical protein [Streptomyces coriariae]